MNSSRLPGKVMMPLCGKPIVEHIYDRLKNVNYVKKVLVVTTDHPSNEILKKFLVTKKIDFYSHNNENDIVGRICNAISKYNSNYILKINSDCPLVDPFLINKLVNKLLENKIDIATNHFFPTYPLGYSFEILSRQIIFWCQKNLKSDYDREYMINWIKENQSQFKTLSISSEKKLDNFILTVDTLEDYKIIKLIFEKLYKNNKFFGLNDVINLISKKSFSHYFSV